MCVAPAIGMYQSKGGRNFMNNYTPVGLLYKAASGGQTLTDSVKSGNAVFGLGTAALVNRLNKNKSQDNPNAGIGA